MSGEPRTPDEDIPQDPGIPGGDVIRDPSDSPPPDEPDASTEERERPDDPDHEGHMSSADS